MISEVVAYVVAVGAVVVALITIYMMRSGRKKTREEPSEVPKAAEMLSLRGERTITNFDAQKSKKELRLLDVEREILSYGIRRLYEAQAEGKISEKERERLAQGYKHRMLEIKDAMATNESVVALHELESMQEDLVKLFNDRFDEINDKIGSLRVNLDMKPAPEIPVPSPALPSSRPEKAKRKPRKPSAPKKTEAEERIDQIRAEVEKVLERLGQMETEA
ncbi:MAG: hypothetical protein JSW14_06920 [Candidatus Bathyarchaeum sp.]|nr:MAG: hypothetical protein JSW14_06920 [Candidatus Bathyarchaeum sp.]